MAKKPRTPKELLDALQPPVTKVVTKDEKTAARTLAEQARGRRAIEEHAKRMANRPPLEPDTTVGSTLNLNVGLREGRFPGGFKAK